MTATTPAPGLVAGTWDIDTAHSEIAFTVRHLMSTVRGSFTTFSGRIDVADDPFESSARVEIEMASIDTRNDERDDHVRSAEILDIANHPLMTFATSGVAAAKTGAHAARRRYTVTGDLTIRGVTNPVTLLTEFVGTSPDQWGGTRAGFTVTTSITRSDFGVEFNIPLFGDGMVLGDQIDIQLEIQAVLSSETDSSSDPA